MESQGEVKLEHLVRRYLDSRFEFDAFPQEVRAMQFKVCVLELLPVVWVTDQHHYIEAVFTREGFNEFLRFSQGFKLRKFKGMTLLVKRWSLVANKADPQKVLTSYAGLQVRLVIEQFQLLPNEKVPSFKLNGADNLFHKNKQIQVRIDRILHQHNIDRLKALPQGKPIVLNAIKAENSFDLRTAETSTLNSTDSDSDEEKGLKALLERDFRTHKLLDTRAQLVAELSEEKVKEIEKGSLEWIESSIQSFFQSITSAQQLIYHTVQLQDVPMESKDARKQNKPVKRIKGAGDLDLVQMDKAAKKNQLTEDDILNGRTEPEPRKPKAMKIDQEAKKPRTPQQKCGVDQALVKQQLLKILNPKLADRPGQDEKKKYYSEEDLLNKGPMLQMPKADFRQEAMSQLISHRRLDDEDEQTETEQDENEEALEGKRLGMLTHLKMNMFLFQKFIKWNRTHVVSQHPLLTDTAAAERRAGNAQQPTPQSALLDDEHMHEEQDDMLHVPAKESPKKVSPVKQDVNMESAQEEGDDEEEEEEPVPVRRSSRIKKPVIKPQVQDEEVEPDQEMAEEANEESDKEEVSQHSSQKSSETEQPAQQSEKKGFQTILGEDEDKDSSQQLDEEYKSVNSQESLQSEESKDRVPIEIQKQQQKEAIRQVLQGGSSKATSRNTRTQSLMPKMEISSEEEEEDEDDLAKYKPTEEDLQQEAEDEINNFKQDAEDYSEQESIQNLDNNKFMESPKRHSPARHVSPKRVSPVKQLEESDDEEIAVYRRSAKQLNFDEDEEEQPRHISSSAKKQRRKDSSESERQEPEGKKTLSYETPKQAFMEEVAGIIDKKTAQTAQAQGSSQSSNEEPTSNTLDEGKKKAGYEMFFDKPHGNPIAMKNSSFKKPSDFASLNFNANLSSQTQENLDRTRVQAEQIVNKRAPIAEDEDSYVEAQNPEEDSDDKPELGIPDETEEEDDDNVPLPEENDPLMSPTVSIKPTKQELEHDYRDQEKYMLQGPLFDGKSADRQEESPNKALPSFGGAGTPEFHRSQQSENASMRSNSYNNADYSKHQDIELQRMAEENLRLKRELAQAKRNEAEKRRQFELELEEKREKNRRKEEKRKKRELKKARKEQEERERRMKFQEERRRLMAGMREVLTHSPGKK